MELAIDLTKLGFSYDAEGNPEGAKTIEDLIIQGAIAKVLSGSDIEERIRETIRSTTYSVVDEMVRERVTEAFEAPIQRTTAWGESKGDPTTVREIIRTSVESYVNAPSGNDNRGNDRGSKNLSELINAETKNILERDMKAVIAAAKQSVTEKVTAQAVQAASTAITATFAK